MKIHTRTVISLETSEILEDESFEYDGPVSEAKGGGGNTTTVQQADPWSGIQPYLLGGYERLDELAGQTPTFYPGQTYAGFDPYQLQSQQMQLGAADAMNPMIQQGNQAMAFGLNAPMDPANNPTVQKWANAAVQPITEAYKQNVMPAIQDSAVATGGLGGSRQGVAEGIAAGNYMDAVGNTTANIYNQAYGQGLDQQARMMTMMPQQMNNMMMPGNIYGAVGGQNQQLAQMGINEDIARHNFDQNVEYDRQSQYLNTLAGTPWGGSSVTGANPNADNEMMNMAGGALAGAGLYSMMGSGPMSVSNPWLGGAMLAGGAMGLWG